MVIELLMDLKRLRKAKKVRNMVIKYLEDTYNDTIECITSRNPMSSLTFITVREIFEYKENMEDKILSEHNAYLFFKGEIVDKWKGRLGFKKGD